MLLKRFAIFVHRWLGVALCLLFLIWFPSGIGIMYWDFPSVTPADRLERSPALDASKVVLSPGEAYAKLNTVFLATGARLNTFDGRPVYRFRSGRDETMVFADTGEIRGDVSRDLVERSAAGWVGQPADRATVRAVEEVDQWTVQAPLRSLRPLWKYSWPNGEQVYVSQTTGEVVQYTTRSSRLGAYVGPIPHWLYFTPLRKRQATWSSIVIWTSGIGTVSAILGLVVAVWMYSPKKRYRYAGQPTSIPYRGQKRWHMVFGLIFGIATATWAFSGMLSMDPFPTRRGGPSANARGEGVSLPEALRGRFDLDRFAARHPREALELLKGSDVKELEFTTFAGEPFYLAVLGGGDSRVVPMSGSPRAELDRDKIIEVITTAAGPERIAESRLVESYDRYYLDRRGRRPLPVILVRLNDDAGTRHYIDPAAGRIVGGYSSRNWITRWLYHGLHSLDFPWLYNYRPLWDIVVIAFMAGGTALSVTSLILAWRVLGRGLRATMPARRGEASAVGDDLAMEAD
jgi:hypothetical protein